MSLAKASRATLVAQITAQMEQMIESGQWKVGEKIPPEPELVALFDVSRNTLREGVQALVHVGLLETRQGIGTTVKSDSSLALALEKRLRNSNLLEGLEVRLVLEREAARFAAERRRAEDLHQMELCLNACTQAAQGGDSSSFVRADIAFHKAVVAAAHNQIFTELYEHITDTLQVSIDEIMRANKAIRVGHETHTALFRAIQAQNAQLATDCVDRDLTEAKRALNAILNL